MTERCPDLGLVGNRDQVYSVTSHRHRCYVRGQPERIATQYQARVCLVTEYGHCPRRGVTVTGARAAAGVQATPAKKPKMPRRPWTMTEFLVLGLGLAILLAVAFTGYALDRRSGTVRHQPRQWDDGEKEFLGRTGRFSGGDIVNLVFEQEACARYLPRKLWEFFVYEDPSPGVVDELASVFAEKRFEVGPVLERIFLSQEFYSERAIRTRIKCPVEYLVQMFRQLELEALPQRYLARTQEQLGQLLLMPPNVAGWDWGKAWINTSSLLSRYNAAGYVTKGAGGRKGRRQARRGSKRQGRDWWAGPDYESIAPPELRSDPEGLVRVLAWRLFQDDLQPDQRARFEAYAASKKEGRFTDMEVAGA